MSKLSTEQLKKLAAVEMIAEVNDNFDIISVINNLTYIPTAPAPAFTDGKRVFISDSLFQWTPKQIYFVLNHEFDHIYYRHHNRFVISKLNRYIVNIATDLIINEILEKEGMDLPDGVIKRRELEKLLGRKIKGKTSEEVFKELLKIAEDKKKEAEEEKEKQKQEQQDENQSKDPDGQGDQKDENQESDSQTDSQSKENKPGKNKFQKSEAQSKEKDSDEFDDQDADGNGSQESKEDVSEEDINDILDKILGKDKGKEYREEIDKEAASVAQAQSQPQKDEEEKEKLEKIKERVEAKQGMATGQDKAELERNYTPPVIDWKKMLRRFLGRYLKRREMRNPMRPTTRYDDVFVNSKVLIPSNRGYIETPFINVYLDVSGSMSGIIQNVRTILADAKRYFKQYSGKYYEFDDQLYEFKREDFYKNKGTRGGTNITKVLTHYEQDRKADLGILITDAQDEFSQTLDSIQKPTLILTNNKTLKTNNKKVTVVVTNFE